MSGTLDPAIFAIFLTAAGAPIASGVISAAVEFLKRAFPVVLEGRERMVAFLFAILVVVVATIVGLVEVPPRYSTATLIDVLMLVFGAVLAVYNIGRLAMGIHDDVKGRPGSLTEAPEPPIVVVPDEDAPLGDVPV